MKNTTICILFFAASAAWAGKQHMPGMPLIQPKKTTVIQTAPQGETLLEDRGFGAKEPEVRMMNLMMVEGSGYEGMDMEAGMKTADAGSSGHGAHSGHGGHAAYSAQVPAPESSAYEWTHEISPSPTVGTHALRVTVKDAKTGKPVKGLKLRSSVYMTNMDMGTESPKVSETKTGSYEVKVHFSMKGPWAVKLTDGKLEKVFEFTAVKP